MSRLERAQIIVGVKRLEFILGSLKKVSGSCGGTAHVRDRKRGNTGVSSRTATFGASKNPQAITAASAIKVRRPVLTLDWAKSK